MTQQAAIRLRSVVVFIAIACSASATEQGLPEPMFGGCVLFPDSSIENRAQFLKRLGQMPTNRAIGEIVVYPSWFVKRLETLRECVSKVATDLIFSVEGTEVAVLAELRTAHLYYAHIGVGTLESFEDIDGDTIDTSCTTVVGLDLSGEDAGVVATACASVRKYRPWFKLLTPTDCALLKRACDSEIEEDPYRAVLTFFDDSQDYEIKLAVDHRARVSTVTVDYTIPTMIRDWQANVDRSISVAIHDPEALQRAQS